MITSISTPLILCYMPPSYPICKCLAVMNKHFSVSVSVLHRGMPTSRCILPCQMAVWRCYNGSCTVHIRQSKLGASWRCILHRRTATAWCKILHRGVAVRGCKIHRQLAPSLFWEFHSRYLWGKVNLVPVGGVYILHRQTATARCKILHRGVPIRQCKIHRQLAPSLFWELHSTYKAK